MHRLELHHDMGINPDVNLLPAGIPFDTTPYMPKWDPSWTRFDGDVSKAWIKPPDYKLPPAESQSARRKAVEEIQNLERISGDPHRNICKYYGCVVEDDLVAGLAFERMDYTLSEAMNKIRQGDSTVVVDAEMVLRDIRAAIYHLLTLNLIYMDISSRNIMFKDSPNGGRWCLVDFGLIFEVGHVFTSFCGTPGWIDHSARVASVEVMEGSLKIVEEYILSGGVEPESKDPEILILANPPGQRVVAKDTI